MILYTDLVREVVEDLALRVPDFKHLDPDRIAILATARSGGQSHGNLATCYSLTGQGEPTFSIWAHKTSRKIVAASGWYRHRCPRVTLNDDDATYLILLRLPRMLHRNPLLTIVHELYHIGERFDGSMRPVRHGRFFNSEVKRLTRQWLGSASGRLGHLAQMSTDAIEKEYGAILAHGVPTRFRVPVVEPCEAPETYEAGVRRLYPGHILPERYEVRPAPVSPEAVPRALGDRDLVVRHYTREGSRKVSSAFARYSRSPVEETA